MSDVQGTPDTRYAKSGHVHIAYQVNGDGDRDLLVVPSFVSHLEAEWEEFAQYRRFFEYLGKRFRVIRFDKRGVGMSDHMGESVPSVEERMSDMQAVMKAVDSERAAVLGLAEGGAISILFSATFPEKTEALVLWGTTARQLAASGYPGTSPEIISTILPSVEELWGTGVMFSLGMAASLTALPGFQESAARIERLAASPGAIAAITRMNIEFDVRHALELVQVPVLVTQRTEDAMCPVAHGRYLVEHLSDARFVQYPGADSAPWFGDDSDQVAADIEAFIMGEPTRPVQEVSRVLATVLFTDIVDSTARAATLGDQRWRRVLEQHDQATRDQIERFSGHLVKNTGDGCLATFDSPGGALRCAIALRDIMRASAVPIRAGLHVGEVEKRDGDIGGIAVHIGSRVSAQAKANEILASRTVVDLVAGSNIEFEDRGEQKLKGVPGAWQLFAVTD